MMAVTVLFAALSLPAGFDRDAFCAAAQAILREAGSVAAAEKLARERGHSAQEIWLAKRICRPAKQPAD